MLPLALYLLTFVIVFQRRPIIPHWLVVELQPLFIIGLVAVILFDPVKTIVGVVAVHVAVFFVCALMCHGELALRRPAPQYLTSFYLWMSAGGVIGGIAAGLIAPHVFNWVAEYPILIALAVLCRPGLALPSDRRWRYALLGGLAAAAALLVISTFVPVTLDETTFNWTVGALLAACVLASRTPLPFAAIVAFILLANHNVVEQAGATSVRSFFGVAKISETSNGQFRILQHGTTLHGGQRIRLPNGQPAPDPPELLLYYWDGSSISQAFDAVRARIGGPIRYAVIGLGAGSLACRAEPDDTVHYYEIDPAIIRIARDPNLFTFLSACRPDVPITLGDARLTLAEAPDGAYDLIVVDAFSSDAIPIHLVTREAMAIYLKKLSPHGMVVMHVSNRHLELASVVAGIAAANGLITLVNDSVDIDEAANPYKFSGTVAAVARSEEDFGPLAQARDWELQEPDPQPMGVDRRLFEHRRIRDPQAQRGDSGAGLLAPEPPENLGRHVADGEQHAGPKECRGEVRELEAPIGHVENARDQRHRGAQRSEEAADEDRKHAPALHECFALRQQFGMARQRPDVRDRRAELDADPVGQPIAERRADRAGNPDRPEIEIAGSDQHADPDQRRPGRKQQRNERQQLAEGERKNDRRRPRLVDAHELHHLVGVSFEAREHAGGSPVTLQGLACRDRQDQTARAVVLNS